MTEVAFPVLNQSDPDAEGVVSTWFADEGDSVTAGQLVAEVQVDKVSAEVHSPCDGTIARKVAENTALPQGSLIATIS